ncbi:hypothetical protein [Lactiplantibacillus daowaiensis]|uniref:Extracellular protein n=1 Tax=Lactiplantibacillus daowaiensis TaxID=2559918 RepID=A0ABW1RYL4_9LACO|nr:hypothetical protein [Lactiplantibacillus daowaiensis]
MKKALLSVAAVLLLTPMVMTAQPVQAASWHSGAPKAIRGKYQAKKHSSAQGFGDIYQITAHTYTYGASGMPGFQATKLRYKKLSAHTWRLQGKVKANPSVHFSKIDEKIYRKGKKFAATDYGTKFSKLSWATKVSAFH